MLPTIPERHQTGIYPIASGLSMEWKNEGQILVFTWRSISRETIDDFAKTYRAVVETWPVEEPLNQLNDLRFKGFSFTPYLRHTIQQVIDESSKRGIKGRVANVMLPDVFMRVVQFFLRNTSFDPDVKAEIFADFNKGMAWLEQNS